MDLDNNALELPIKENEFSKLFNEKMCRACLNDKNLLPLFIEQDDCLDAGNGILNTFILCTGLEASWNDQYPKHICQNCLEELYKYYDFWKKCRNSVEVLSKVLNNLTNDDYILENDSKSPLKDILDDDLIETECEKNVLNAGSLNDEITSTVSDNTQQQAKCFKCEETFYTDINYIKHNCVDNKKVITCEHCGETFSTIDKRRKHILKKHRSARNFKCDQCMKTFHFELGLASHKRTHESEKPFRCIICNTYFKTRRILYSHKLTEHEVVHKHNCLLCDLGYDKSAQLKLHLKTLHPDIDRCTKQHLCQDCGRVFSSDTYLKEHIRTIHLAIEQHPCDLCGKKFRSKNYLKVHMRIHAVDNKYECKDCGEKFKTWNLRAIHIRNKHSDETPFVCKICNKGFKFSSRLTVHLRIHKGEKPFACQECPKAFVSTSSLKAHNFVHTGEKRYNCPICKKKFSRSHLFRKHMIIHTKRRKYVCDVCGSSFKLEKQLEIHMKTHENLEEVALED